MKTKLLFRVLALAAAALILILSVSAYDASLPRVVDRTGTFSAQETGRLDSISEEFRREYSMDCVIMLINSLGGKTPEAYADDAYDEGGYGMGNDNSGILFLISVGDREVYISTCGEAIDYIDDYEIERILDDMMYSLSDGEWCDAFSAGVDAAGRMIERPNGNPDGCGMGPADYGEDSFSTGERLLVVFIVPAVIGGIAVGVMCYMMNNVRGKYAAADYAVKGSFALSGALDIFLSRHVTKTPRAEQNSGSHGGGGSTHISSGGISHGGGGRHF